MLPRYTSELSIIFIIIIFQQINRIRVLILKESEYISIHANVKAQYHCAIKQVVGTKSGMKLKCHSKIVAIKTSIFLMARN